MAGLVKYVYGTEAQILALIPTDSNWYERGFYYPSDKTYFYQAVEGVMKKYGDTPTLSIGIGVTLNEKVIGGVKVLIENEDILTIPDYYDYNTFTFNIAGIVNCSGQINMLL